MAQRQQQICKLRTQQINSLQILPYTQQVNSHTKPSFSTTPLPAISIKRIKISLGSNLPGYIKRLICCHNYSHEQVPLMTTLQASVQWCRKSGCNNLGLTNRADSARSSDLMVDRGQKNNNPHSSTSLSGAVKALDFTSSKFNFAMYLVRYVFRFVI